MSQAMAHHRVLTAYLRPDPTKDRTYTQHRDNKIVASATSFCDAFKPWASRSQDQRARFDSLVNILRSATDVGIHLFAQPTSYEYQWQATDGKRLSSPRISSMSTIIVLPAFVRVTDDSGKRLERAQIVLPAVSVAT